MGQISIGEKIKIRREQLNYSLQDIADKMDVHRSTIMRWENGETSRIKLATIEKLAQILTTSPGYLMGYETAEEKDVVSRSSSAEDACFLPVLRKVYEGDGLYNVQNIITYELADARYRYAHCFYMFASGDSMAPALEDGDRVLVKRQKELKDGQIGLFLLDEKTAVIRQFYQKNVIELKAFNPYYPVLRIKKEEEQSIKLIGQVLESKRVW